MGPRTTVAVGLVAGVVTAGLLFAALLLVVPPLGEAGASPSPSPASPSPSPASPSPSPASPSPASPSPASPSPSPANPSPGPSASASPSAGPSSTPSATVATIFHIGETAPPLVVEELGTGTPIDLASLRGKPVWLNFMATWCPPCRDELPLMTGYAARYADDGLVVLAVDVREADSVVAAYMTSVGVTFPVGLDPDGTAQAGWGAYALPVHYWIDASGVIRDGALGGIGPDIMAQGLGSILPGVTVSP